MSPVYMLDTNVLSEFSKLIPNTAIMNKLHENEGICAICATVWQELVSGYERMPDGKRKRMVGENLELIKKDYTILPYDDFAAQICGELTAKCMNVGQTVPFADSQIAATTIANGMVLVTHNTADYQPICENSMLRIEDWWE